MIAYYLMDSIHPDRHAPVLSSGDSPRPPRPTPTAESLPDANVADAFLTTREAAQVLGVSLRTVQLWVDGGTLDAWKTVGGHRRVTKESVERLRPKALPAPPEPTREDHADDIFLARQPILDRREHIVGYELLCRRGAAMPDGADDSGEATAQTIVHAFSDLGMGVALGKHQCHINVDTGLLDDETLHLLPRGQIAFELDSNAHWDDAAVERCRDIKRQGFRLALDRFTAANPNASLLALADIVKVDVGANEPARLTSLLRRLRSATPAKLLADKVESPERFRQCRDLGFDLFQGYYFAHPRPVAGKRIDPSRAALLNLLNLLMGDAGNREIEQALKASPALCYHLLRLANSAAMGLNRRIGAIGEVINILGRRHLQRWTHLLLFAHRGERHHPNPLLQLAALRGRLMERLAALARPGQADFHDRAFMTGILSLLDILLETPMSAVLAEIDVADDIRGALLDRAGELGQMLSLCHALEGRSDAHAAPPPTRPPFDGRSVMLAQAEALHWAGTIGNALLH